MEGAVELEILGGDFDDVSETTSSDDMNWLESHSPSSDSWQDTGNARGSRQEHLATGGQRGREEENAQPVIGPEMDREVQRDAETGLRPPADPPPSVVSSSINFDEGNEEQFSFELPFDYTVFDPPPVDNRDSGSENAESRKRLRDQAAGATAPARRVPAAAGASHKAAGIKWCADVPPSLDVANHTRWLDVPIPFEIAAYLLSHDDALNRRPRPRFLEGTAETIHGQVFKDSVTRRGKGSDRYEFKGGPQNCATSPVLGVAADGTRLAVRRSYGRVSTSRVGARGGAAADVSTRSKVHQYALLAISEDGKQELLQPHLFHIVGMADENATVKSETVEHVRTSTAGHVGKNPAGDPNGAPSNIAPGAGSGRDSSGGGLLEDGLEVSGLLTLKQPKARAPWVIFENPHGDPVGKIGPSRGGIALTSGSGDFAEWHARAPGEKPFITGEVVSIGSSGLSRDTVHAKQLGIISRQAIVTGSMPSDPTEAAAGDTIAYAGRVMVRLRGGCTAGDHIVPSGLEDGTATATRVRKGRQVVGRAVRSCAASILSDKRQTIAGREGEEDRELDRGPNSSTAVQLVECAVIAPPNTVADPVRWWKANSSALAAAVAGCTIAVFAYVVVTVALASHATAACAPLEPPTNMRITGQCDGTVGSRCVYEGCDDGFVMRLASAASARLLAPESQQGQPGGMIRECLSSGAGVYSGSPLVCARAYCPRVVDNCSSVTGCCINCGDGSDVVVTFPSANVHVDPSFSSSSGNVDGATTVTLPCPSMHDGVPMRGMLTRRCIGSTSSGEGGVWSPLNGSCTRSGCASVTHVLAGYSIALRAGTEAAKQLASDDHTLRFPDAVSGTGIMELPCPSKGYTGSISMTCNTGSTEWSNPVGECVWLHCPSRLHNAGTRTRPVPMTLPSLSAGDTVTMSCCSRFTLGGGCAGPADGIGVVTAKCVEDGKGGYAFDTSGQCTPSANFRLGLTASTASDKNGTELMRQLWSKFSSEMSTRLLKSTGGAWTLPSDGMLGVLNLQRGNEWGTVATSPAFTSAREGSLNTRSLGVQSSSRAVAAGNVACRELGFAGASVVTNCQAITNLVKANKGIISESDELLSALCSASFESVWLEINSGWDQAFRQQNGEWLSPVYRSDNISLYRGPPPWLPSVSQPSWCVGDEMDSQSLSRATDCDLESGDMSRSGVCTSASATAAGALARCMQFDLFKHPNGPDPNLVQKRAGRDKSIPRNNYHLVLGCTGWGEAPPAYPIVHGALRRQAGRSGGRGGGTWVVGDGLGTFGHDDLSSPKIFADTMPHLRERRFPVADAPARFTAMARLEAASAPFYDSDVEVDLDGALLQFRDDNFTYPGVATCNRGCVQTMFDSGELRQFNHVDDIPLWWCSRSCRA